MTADKLQPRNRTARLAQARAIGNPVSTELESSVGNCFPGLELDLRNLDRRFFPFLVVDLVSSSGSAGNQVQVAEVDLGAAQADLPAGPLLDGLRAVEAGLRRGGWAVSRLRGDFAGFGTQSWEVSLLAQAEQREPPTRPPDAWTAIRLLKPGTTVELVLRGPGADGRPQSVTVSAPRVSYLADDGAFSAMFEPGELTQSLCSPWTHDFRDCGCWYWASNHPDIVQPAVPTPQLATDPAWSGRTPWQRADRTTTTPPPEVVGPPERLGRVRELAHYEINGRWEDLDIVLDGREQRAPYEPGRIDPTPIPAAALVGRLRYAAGVELAVTLEYLSAYYSIDPAAGATGSTLRGDVRAARGELLRVAISEMTHLASVNRILRSLHRITAPQEPFVPALGVATTLPGSGGQPGRSVQSRPLTAAVLADFIAIEAPSDTVDGLYLGILARLEADGHTAEAAAVNAIIADGADHFATFRDMREWLVRHPESSYLRPVAPLAPTDRRQRTVRDRYAGLLAQLLAGYRAGLPPGAADIAAARLAMVAPGGLDEACEALSAAGGLVLFPTPAGAEFTPVPPPPALP
jgi:hypothetical protein